MSSTITIGWHAANQRHLMSAVGEVRVQLAQFLGGDAAPEPTEVPTFEDLPEPALGRLCDAFGLTSFERNILLLCAGVELESRFGRLLTQGKNAIGSAHPTFGLALSVFDDAHWSALTAAGPLRHWRLIEIGPGDSLTTSPLRISERVLHYLAGVNTFDEYLQTLVSPVAESKALTESHQQIVDWIVATRPPDVLMELRGNDPGAIGHIAAAAARHLGLRLYSLPVRNAPTSAADIDTFAKLWAREAVLSSCGLLIEFGDVEGTEAANATALIQALKGFVILSSASPRPISTRPTVVMEVSHPSVEEQSQLWRSLLGSDATAEALSKQFHLSSASIRNAAAQVLSRDTLTSLQDELWMACRKQARPRLDRIAQRIESSAQWDDLVLPEPQKQILRQIAVHVRRRSVVYGDWGFASRGSRGLGISALFAGPSGTGKTMASEVLANELGLDLYRVDLSQVVSKYIGETEKNLAKVFDAAEESAAVLLFDEADALFGKRTEVKDSHDRYANIEVSYLLQRMEEYRGLAILTTNRKRALDQAFLRRIRFVAEFPFPDFAQRAELWRRAFPAQTPTRGLSIDALARLNAAGGNIKNIALGAAFLAADAGEPVSMKHLLDATRTEFAKSETPLTELEVAGWA